MSFNCLVHGGIPAASSIRFTFDAAGDNDHSTVVCSGWLIPNLPDVDQAEGDLAERMGAECEGVPPSQGYERNVGTAPDDATSFRIRVDFGDADDNGTLAVFVDDVLYHQGQMKACGIGIWSFTVLR